MGSDVLAAALMLLNASAAIALEAPVKDAQTAIAIDKTMCGSSYPDLNDWSWSASFDAANRVWTVTSIRNGQTPRKRVSLIPENGPEGKYCIVTQSGGPPNSN
jgi:hypothetical protein